MSRYYDNWAPYVPVAERRRRAARAMDKLRKKGHPVAPVIIEGRAIAATFWGKAWCDNLESYRDYESRLPRGRTYVRNGSVADLQIAPTEVTAMVSGSSIYKVKISIGRIDKKQWASICKDCAGGIDSLIELLQGRLSKGVIADSEAKQPVIPSQACCSSRHAACVMTRLSAPVDGRCAPVGQVWHRRW
jgi:hypothetical protein